MMEQDRGAIVHEPVIEDLTEDQKIGIMKYVSQLLYTATLGVSPIGGKDIFLPSTQQIVFRDAGQTIGSAGGNILELRATTTIQNRVATVTVDEKISHYGDLDTYFKFETNKISHVAGNNTRFATDATGIKFFGSTGVAQGAHIADATDAASAISQLNLLLAQLETYGLLATS